MALVLAIKDRAQARWIQRLSAAGQLRRLCPGVYTDDLVQPLESIVRRELFALCSLVAPGSIIAHRLALEGGRRLRNHRSAVVQKCVRSCDAGPVAGAFEH
jgi:hypothetical protein